MRHGHKEHGLFAVQVLVRLLVGLLHHSPILSALPNLLRHDAHHCARLHLRTVRAASIHWQALQQPVLLQVFAICFISL